MGGARKPRMHIGFDVTDLIEKTHSGIPRYGDNLVQALLRFAPQHRFTLFVSGQESWFKPETIQEARARFEGAEIRLLFGGLTPHRPSETNFAKRWGLSKWLGPADLAARHAYALVNNSTSAWAMALRRGGRRSEVERPEVMHHLSYGINYPFRRAGNVISIHDLIPRLFPQWQRPFSRKLLERALRFASRCDEVIVDSECTRRDLLVAGFASEGRREKVTTILLAPEDVFQRLERRHAEERLKRAGLVGGTFFLYVGTLEPRKNIPNLVAAFSVLKGRHTSEPLRLVLAGRKGWDYEPVFDEIKRRSLTDQVVHVADADDKMLVALMNSAVAMVFPSLYEGFGLPVVEAMACGCPVIASNRASIPEVLGDAGILVDPENVNALADAMARVLQEEGVRDNLRELGLARARLFSWRKVAEQTMEVYERAAARSASA
jgi:glycosyltransferase involved in cell wall biosynthesis